MSGKKPKELVGPDFPEPLRNIWSWFCALSARRGQGLSGYLLITYTEMDAFFRRRNLTPQIWELELLERLDQIYLDMNASQDK